MLKLADGDERGRRELAFYQMVFCSDCPMILQRLRSFVSLFLYSPWCDTTRRLHDEQMPQFYGCRTIAGRDFMVLEDVSCGGRNVMDIKIGATTWDPSASEEKVAAEKSKFHSGLLLGFRVLGFRVRLLLAASLGLP